MFSTNICMSSFDVKVNVRQKMKMIDEDDWLIIYGQITWLV